MPVNKKMSIGEVLRMDGDTAAIFMSFDVGAVQRQFFQLDVSLFRPGDGNAILLVFFASWKNMKITHFVDHQQVVII